MLECIDMDMECSHEPGAGLLDGETFELGHWLSPRIGDAASCAVILASKAVIAIAVSVNPIAGSKFD